MQVEVHMYPDQHEIPFPGLEWMDYEELDELLSESIALTYDAWDVESTGPDWE